MTSFLHHVRKICGRFKKQRPVNVTTTAFTISGKISWLPYVRIIRQLLVTEKEFTHEYGKIFWKYMPIMLRVCNSCSSGSAHQTHDQFRCQESRPRRMQTRALWFNWVLIVRVFTSTLLTQRFHYRYYLYVLIPFNLNYSALIWTASRFMNNLL